MKSKVRSLVELLECLPEEKLNVLNGLLDKIKPLVVEEVSASFKAIIEKYGDYGIYYLGLYFSGGSWGYCSPTFSSERGLKHVVKSYQINSVLNEEEQEICLRWSSADSPHHENEDYLDYINGFDQLLRDFEIWEESIDFYTHHYVESFDEYIELVRYRHKRCWELVTEALVDVRKVPVIDQYCKTTGCVVGLEGTDQDIKYWLETIGRINGEQKRRELDRQTRIARRVAVEEMKRWNQREREEYENPPVPQFTIDDLMPVVNKFNPVFQVMDDGAILLDPPYHQYYAGENISAGEFSANRTEVMPLLRTSDHAEEVQKLYGHFIGPDFHETHIVTEFARRVRTKLGECLLAQFPDEKFVLYMHISRMARPMINFYKIRDDGYKHSFLNSSEDTELNRGTEESVIVG